jgi:histone H3/H4
MPHPITKPALTRLIKDASFDTIQISGLVYEEMRGKLINHVRHIIDTSLIYMEHAQLKTLSVDNVVSALPAYPILGGEHHKSIKTCKKSPKKSGKKSAKKAPKKSAKKAEEDESDKEQGDGEQGDGEQDDIEKCFYFPKQSFRHFVVSLIEGPVRVSSDALALLQIESEHFLLKLASQAAELMRHAGRATLQPKDVNRANLLATSCSQNVNLSVSKMASLTHGIEKQLEKMGKTGKKKETAENLNTVLNVVGQALVNKAESIAKKSTVATRDVETAVRLILPDEMPTYASKNVDKIIKNPLLSADTVGELFHKDVSENAKAHLAAVLEYVTAELVRNMDEKEEDDQINNLFKNLGLFTFHK